MCWISGDINDSAHLVGHETTTLNGNMLFQLYIEMARRHETPFEIPFCVSSNAKRIVVYLWMCHIA